MKAITRVPPFRHAKGGAEGTGDVVLSQGKAISREACEDYFS
jgi:hypothetical protein